MLGARGGFPPLLPRQRQIEIPVADRVDERHAAVDPHLHLDARMRAPEMAEHLWQPGLGKILQHAESHLARERGLLERGHRLIVELEQPARVAEHDLAFGREREATPLFSQKCLAGRFLELAELQADRRLRSAEPAGGLGIAAEVEAGHEGAQDIQIEVEG
jgi:hypothetical protein